MNGYYIFMIVLTVAFLVAMVTYALIEKKKG